MGLSDLLSRAAASRAHVLVVATPRAFTTRVALERALLGRGWVQAESPADADVLAVCGHEHTALTEELEAVWDAMPGPRVRVDVADPKAVPAVLDRAAEQLLATDQHVHDAQRRGPVTRHMDHGDMDHGDMDMAPAGIPLAEGAEDRDGLEMDVLHLSLGPVLPHWPPGLVLHCTLHGDVATEVQVELVGEPTTGYDAADTRDSVGVVAARSCDAVVSVLALAGWPVGEAVARRARDACLDGNLRDAAQHLTRLRRRVVRSWLLRWMLRGIGRLDHAGVQESGAAQQVAGDVYDRLVALIDRAGQGLRGEASAAGNSADLVAALPALLAGSELASLRLAVASLDLGSALARLEAADV
ncbi:MAG: hypothetical protein ABI776_05075 [Nocardioidaceae bacterium]